MNQRKLVALNVETSTHFGRQVLTGILRYKLESTDWRVELIQSPGGSGHEWIRDWDGDGIISRTTPPEIARQSQERSIPLIEIGDSFGQDADLTTLRWDDEMIGVLGAEHFIERGFQQFAFLGTEAKPWSARRARSFRERVVADHHGFDQFDLPQGPLPRLDAQSELAMWLKQLPKPVGIMACNDFFAKMILDTCLLACIGVPEPIAVIGVDNDELICKFCEPMLSSVVPNAQELGYRAANALDKVMQGEEVAPMQQIIEPIDICLRSSSDTVAIKDDEFMKVLVFIRQNARAGISVEDVLRQAKLSRSSLERRTRKLLGKSPQQFIRQVQLEQVKKLLSETDLRIEHIARQCGFEHAEYLHVTFKKEFQMTPGEYRRRIYR